jgi:p-cumate 2,3-dioxygenase subunit alpha
MNRTDRTAESSLNPGAPSCDEVIVDDVSRGIFRVNRRVFTDPAILEVERREVFERSWLYVGHESEIAAPGDWLRRKVAGRWFIFLRAIDGKVRIFFDTCTHRGNSLCRGTFGNTRNFFCFYHGWTFNTSGELVGVPDRASYGASFDLRERSLVSPARMESYRGLVFLSFDPGMISLSEYLGRAREYLDLFLDFSDSEIAVTPSQHSYSMHTNWKLLVENSVDVYHAFATHRRYFVDYLGGSGVDGAEWRKQMQDIPDNVGLALGSGHAVVETPAGPLPLGIKGAEFLAATRCRLEKRHGSERTHRILDFSRNLFIFPNLIFVANFKILRTFYPVAPGELDVNAWALLPVGEPPELRRLRLDNFISFLGPGGFGTPDDVEALENCQRNFSASKEVAWSDISRGMLRERALGSDELQMRAFWRRWYGCLNPDYRAGEEPSAKART